MVRRAERQTELTDKLVQRIAALSAEKLALLDKRLRGNLPRPSRGDGEPAPPQATDLRKTRAAPATIEVGLEQDPAVAGNGVHVKEEPASFIPAATSWPHLDRISDDDVSSFLTHLTPELHGEPALSEPPQPGVQSLKDSQVEPIRRISRGRERDLVLSLNQLSNEGVDALLSMLLDTPGALQTSSAFAAEAARAGNHDKHLEALLATLSESKGQSTVAASPLESSFQRTSPFLDKRFELAYLAYVRAVQEASMKSQRRIGEEQFNLSWSTHEAWVARTEPSRPAELQIRYARAVQQIRTETRRSIDSAFLSYLETLREMWLQADIESFDPRSMASISQSMSLAAAFAINSLVNWKY